MKSKSCILYFLSVLYFFREVFTFSDGGEAKLLWSNCDGFTQKTPIVIIIPGINDCGCNDYITSIISGINKRKYR